VKKQLANALGMTLATLVLTGLLYPLALPGIAQVVFPRQANGSLILRDGVVVGSELIGQAFSKAEYIHPRPSAAGSGYDAASSGGSNLGPTSKKLRDRVTAEVARLTAENPDAPGAVPIELVTTSASGLDPHLSPEAALWQTPRVAATRGLALADVENVIRRHIEGRTLGLWGEPRVNVLLVNLALDEAFSPSADTPRPSP
jgi:potassium-transporting ATPase KdpC subunit